MVLDEKGQVGVKSVGAQGKVEFHAARVIASDTNGVWLDGLPPTVSVITVGQQFVRTGDTVRAVEERQGAGL
jgi:multidrug efflux system membrane fusion protein